MSDLAQSNGAVDLAPKIRVRLVAVRVQLEVVADDGETLHPLDVPAERIPAAEWPNWDIGGALGDIQARIVT